MDSGLRGKKALITGGGTGIGRGIALALAKEGVNIAIASRNPSQKTSEEIECLNVQTLRLCVDVSDESRVVKVVEEAIDKLGGLDIYINNAAWAWHQPITKVSTENWLKKSLIQISQHVFGPMKKYPSIYIVTFWGDFSFKSPPIDPGRCDIQKG